MIKNKTFLTNYSLVLLFAFAALVTSCSQSHYAHLNKIPRGTHDVVSAQKEDAKPVDIRTESEETSVADKITPAETAIMGAKAENTEVPVAAIASAKKSVKATGKVTKVSALEKMVANRIVAKATRKMQNSISERKNITSANNTHRSDIIWIIIVVLAVLFLLGLLTGGGGSLGGLIWLILAVALILLILRLLGLF